MSLFAFVVAAATVTIAPLVVVLLTGTFIPIATGLVTRSGASASVKQAATVVLAGLASLIQVSLGVTGAAVFSTDTLILAVASWLVAIAMYHGVYQSHDLNEKLAPERGLGVVDTTAVERIQ